ncbi:MAG TPA: hypothetical protein VEL07_19190 [Planctomycetota bacterium]|nr:hypothetical protein [Planctomycetota bacterium]
MRFWLLLALALLVTSCGGSGRVVDGRLSPYRYVILERVVEDVEDDRAPKGDVRAELAAAFAEVGMEVVDPARASDAAIADETLQCYARLEDDLYVARLDVTLRDLRSGAEAYKGGITKKGPDKRDRSVRWLVLDLQARYGGFSQREADLKRQRVGSPSAVTQR